MWSSKHSEDSPSLHFLLTFIAYFLYLQILEKQPNGTRVQVVGTGSVRINSRIVLHNVLYIPSFHVNLISVPKITPNCKIGVLFEDTFVLFQDTQTHKTIGRGDLHLNLFTPLS